MEWLRSANVNKFDLFGAFTEHKVLDWTKGPFKVKQGDVVFLCVSAPYSKVMFKTVCINESVTGKDVIDDSKYWANPDEFSSSTEFIRLRLIAEVDDDELSVSRLNELNLISGRVQGAFRSDRKPDLFEYINSFFDNAQVEYEEVENQVNQIMGLSETERETIIKTRIGQGAYRNKLLQKHSSKCMLCGLSVPELLIASHIKEWSESSPFERIDPENGLLLCALHDSLFDKHLISFDNNGGIIISPDLSQRDQVLLNIRKGDRIVLSEKMAKYMEYHRNKII